MRRRAVLVASLSVSLAVVPIVSPADAGGGKRQPIFTPGDPGAGDPYFPLDGNGGYDVKRYNLDLQYEPETDTLTGEATIKAKATQNLSSFNLDFEGLELEGVWVGDKPAQWSRDDHELTITPRKGLRKHRKFTTVVQYSGIPSEGGEGAFTHTDDGALVLGEPHAATSWFPANDHPTDTASFRFDITVPSGLEAISNGTLERQRTRSGWTTFTWKAGEPMATYLAMMAIGEYDLHAYDSDGIEFWDALDPDLFDPIALPRTGDQLVLSQIGNTSFKRLARTISVPAEGGSLSFWVDRGTEANWDYVFVEARTAGQDDWTTLPDQNGHTAQETGNVCPHWLDMHPFLTHYQTDNGDDTCAPSGSSGDWWAASGESDGYEQWSVDLGAFAGNDTEVSISYASDESVQGSGVYVDDVEVSTGEGSTSFEDDGDALDGWTMPGAPEGSEPNPNDWTVGTTADVPPPPGTVAEGSFARQPEIINFLADNFGPYPFSAAGGIVDDLSIGFALETQTRPIYSPTFFTSSLRGDNVVVHEIAHQWYGDSLALDRWQHIWLNEGFASYAEWLWSEREGNGTAQEIFDATYNGIPADDPFWALTIGDPGPDELFDGAVYDRGAMTLHQLRLAVGDDDFFRILRRWAAQYEGENVNTNQFIALAERISGQQLDDLFDVWLFTDTKPELPDAQSKASTTADTKVLPDRTIRR